MSTTPRSPVPPLIVSTGIADSSNPVSVTIKAEGDGELRVILNGTVIYRGHPDAR